MKYFNLCIIKYNREMVTLQHHIVFMYYSTFIKQINVLYYFEYQDVNFSAFF